VPFNFDLASASRQLWLVTPQLSSFFMRGRRVTCVLIVFAAVRRRCKDLGSRHGKRPLLESMKRVSLAMGLKKAGSRRMWC
jgi:hypothetical protein